MKMPPCIDRPEHLCKFSSSSLSASHPHSALTRWVHGISCLALAWTLMAFTQLNSKGALQASSESSRLSKLWWTVMPCLGSQSAAQGILDPIQNENEGSSEGTEAACVHHISLHMSPFTPITSSSRLGILCGTANKEPFNASDDSIRIQDYEYRSGYRKIVTLRLRRGVSFSCELLAIRKDTLVAVLGEDGLNLDGGQKPIFSKYSFGSIESVLIPGPRITIFCAIAGFFLGGLAGKYMAIWERDHNKTLLGSRGEASISALLVCTALGAFAGSSIRPFPKTVTLSDGNAMDSIGPYLRYQEGEPPFLRNVCP
jgi:hypothetical protein